MTSFWRVWQTFKTQNENVMKQLFSLGLIPRFIIGIYNWNGTQPLLFSGINCSLASQMHPITLHTKLAIKLRQFLIKFDRIVSILIKT